MILRIPPEADPPSAEKNEELRGKGNKEIKGE
jgi:hypothetical protein